MSIVFDLPTVLQAFLVCEWLKLPDVVRLDSALCCKKLRTDFLELVAGPHSIFAHYMFEHIETEGRWVIKKGVKFKSVYLFADIVLDDKLNIELFLHLCCPALERVTLSTHPNDNCDPDCEKDITKWAEEFIMILTSYCPNVTSVCIECTKKFTDVDEEILLELLTRCKKLKTIVLPNCYCGSNDLQQALYTAPSLESITMTHGNAEKWMQDAPLDLVNHTVSQLIMKDFESWEDNRFNISQVCVHFPNLVKLEATNLSSAEVVAVSNYCPLLQDGNIQ